MCQKYIYKCMEPYAVPLFMLDHPYANNLTKITQGNKHHNTQICIKPATQPQW